MPNMIQTEIMQNHSIPITIPQLLGNMPRHIVIHFCKVLQYNINKILIVSIYSDRAMVATNRNEEATRPVRTRKEVWKELQPRIIAVHDQPPALFRFQLREPCVLGRERGGSV
jgi:hypothetical protein